MESNFKEQEIKFLAAVEDNILVLKKEVLKHLDTLFDPSDDYSLTIISVIGQPKCRKSFLCNSLKDFATENAPKKPQQQQPVLGLDRFPNSCDRDRVFCINEKHEEGILVWAKSFTLHSNPPKKFGILILDIWSESNATNAYTTLVNFCIASSDVIILSEFSHIPQEILWDPSTFQGVLNEEPKQLYVVLHDFNDKATMHFKGAQNETFAIEVEGKTTSEPELSHITSTLNTLNRRFKPAGCHLHTIPKTEFTHIYGKHFRASLEYTSCLETFHKTVITFVTSRYPSLSSKKDASASVYHKKEEPQSERTCEDLKEHQIKEASSSTEQNSNAKDNSQNIIQHASSKNTSKQIETSVEPKTTSSTGNQQSFPEPTTDQQKNMNLAEDVDSKGKQLSTSSQSDAATSDEKPADRPSNETTKGGEIESDRLNASNSKKELPDTVSSRSRSSKESSTPTGNPDSVGSTVSHDAKPEEIKNQNAEKKAKNSVETKKVDNQENIKIKVMHAALAEALTDYKIRMNNYILGVTETELYVLNDALTSQSTEIKTDIFASLKSRFPNMDVKNGLQKLTADIEKVFTEIANIQNQQESYFRSQMNNAHKKSQSVFTAAIEALSNHFNEHPLDFENGLSQISFTKKFQPHINTLLKMFQPFFSNWYLEQTNVFLNDCKLLQKALREYRDALQKDLKEKICLEVEKFKALHLTCLKKLDALKNHQWSHPSFVQLQNNRISRIYDLFCKHNKDTIRWEEEAAGKAVQFALNTYNDFMKNELENAIYTDQQIQILHDIGVKSIQTAFTGSKEFKRSYIWAEQAAKLESILEPLQTHYFKENQKNFNRNLKPKKSLTADCEQKYRECMSTYIASANFAMEKFAYYHNQAKSEALKILDGEDTAFKKALESRLKEISAEIEDKLVMQNKVSKTENVQSIASNVSTPSAGTGIYFGPHVVYLAISKGNEIDPIVQEYIPTVRFTGKEIEFFAPHSTKYYNCFHVYQILLSTQHDTRTVFVNGQAFTLSTEEIVGLFLKKLKHVAEEIQQQEISSCVTATNAFLSSRAKRMLKTSLSMAGFVENKIIQSTTAMGILYITKPNVLSDGQAVLIHNSSSTFEIASAEIKSNTLIVEKITLNTPVAVSYVNPLNWFWDPNDPVSSRVKLFADMWSPIKKTKRLIIASGPKCEKLTEAIKDRLKNPEMQLFGKESDIAVGAAALHASTLSSDPNLAVQYIEVFPYTLTLKINDIKDEVIILKNTHIIPKNLIQVHSFYPATKSRQSLVIREQQNTYVCAFSAASMSNYHRSLLFFVNLNSEGLIESAELKFQGNLHPIPLQVPRLFLTHDKMLSSIKQLNSILPQPIVSPPQDEKNAIHQELANIEMELKAKLSTLIEEVKAKLEKGKTTRPAIVDRVQERIQQCERVVKESDVKAKVLEIEMEKLEIVSKRINED